MYLSHWQWTRGSTSTFFETKLHVFSATRVRVRRRVRERELYYWYVRSDEREDSVQV
jgi:hypothetical protein